MLPRTWSGIGVALVLGCGTDLPPVTDSGPEGLPLDRDVPVVEIPMEALARPPELRLVESLRLGAAEVSDEYTFTFHPEIEVASDGEIYAFDGGAATAFRFDPDGSLLTSFSGEGDGPGEVRRGSGTEIILSPDTVFLFEQSAQTVNAFARDGEHLYSHRTGERIQGPDGPVRYGRTMLQSLVWTVDGLVGWSATYNWEMTEGEEYTDTLVFFRRSHDSGAFQPSGARLLRHDLRLMAQGALRSPFAGTPAHAVLPDGRIVFRRGTDYVLRVVESDGETIRYVRGAVARIPITENDMDRLLKGVRAESERSAGAAPDWAEELRDMPVSRWRPIAGRLVAGNDGTVLVEREDLDSLSTMRRGYATTWDVLDLDEAEVLGRLTMPAGFVPFVYRDSRLYGVNRSDLIPTVIRYDVRAADGRLLSR